MKYPKGLPSLSKVYRVQGLEIRVLGLRGIERLLGQVLAAF